MYFLNKIVAMVRQLRPDFIFSPSSPKIVIVVLHDRGLSIRLVSFEEYKARRDKISEQSHVA